MKEVNYKLLLNLHDEYFKMYIYVQIGINIGMGLGRI